MHTRHFIFIALAGFVGLLSPMIQAQENPFDSLDLGSPVGRSLKLSGTFGELRSSHFHGGLDIKSSNGRIGDPVYAIADGWISRIKIQSGGYGQALYIDHPNGMRSVYGHLHAIAPEFLQLVRDSQYFYQSFHVDLHFKKGKIPVKQGDQIAEMGSKGYSFGPHLHFEIRNATNDVPYNPLLFLKDIYDTRAPVIRDLDLIYLDKDLKIIHRKDIPLRKNNGGYRATTTSQVPAGQHFSLSIRTYDRQNGTGNHNGIYALELWREDSLIQKIEMDSIPYSVIHQLNGYVDYPQYNKYGRRYHRLTELSLDDLPVYALSEPLHYLNIKEEETHNYKLIVRDFLVNSTSVKFTIEGINQPPLRASSVFNYRIFYDSANLIRLNSFAIYFPVNSIYTDQNLYLSTVSDASEAYLSPVLQFTSGKFPLNKALTVKYDVSSLGKRGKAKLFLARCETNSFINVGTEIRNDSIIGHPDEIGNYAVMQDTIPPEIQIIRSSKSPSAGYRFVFQIDDNFNTGGNVPSLKMWAELDEKWHLGEEVIKYHRFYVPVPEEKTGNNHVLKVYAVDALGNKAVKKVEFRY